MTFYLLALSVPVVLVSSSFRGVLEAAQRFDLVNAVTIPSNTAVFLLPLVGLFFGFSLPGILALIILSRFGVLIAFAALGFYISPLLKMRSGSLALFPHLFRFGGWITVLDVINPILMYTDQLLIGSTLSIAAVAYYSVPFEILNRLRVVPASLTMTLFPAFSLLLLVKERQTIDSLFARSVKFTFLALGPIILGLGLFANEVLQIWLGSEFAAQSTVVLQILALGVFITCMGYIPHALLVGAGRPDIPAKFNLLELPLYIGIAWFLINQWGITGAAVAWTFRTTLDALLLFIASFKVTSLSLRLWAANGILTASVSFIALLGIAYGSKRMITALPLLVQFLLFLIIISLFVWVVWRNVMDDLERQTLLTVMKIKRSN